VVAEEVLFRGYILQAVARMSRRWWLRLLVPAALFTLAHIANNEFQTGGLWAAADYTAVALYLGYLALRSGGLEHAIGVHLGLNTALLAFVGLSVGDFQTPTVVLIAVSDFRLGLLGTVIICAVHYLLVMRRSG
jgi:membrane protease YdiL (CAAX protease family)